MALIDNLISYYKLDESSGDAADSVGANTAVNTNVTYGAGKINNGAVFNGSSARLSFSTTGFPSGSSPYTHSLWIKPTALPGTNGYVGLLEYGTGTTNHSVGLFLHNNGGTQYVSAAVYENDLEYAKTLTLGQWYHIVDTYDGTNLNIYINGVLVSSGARSPDVILGGTKHYFGYLASGSTYFNGMIDEAGIWTRALNSDEIAQLFNSGRANQYSFVPVPALYGAISYHKLDESSGNAADSVGIYTLTNTNVTYGAGKINNGAVFNGTSAYFTGNVAISGIPTISVNMWVNNPVACYGSLFGDRNNTSRFWSFIYDSVAGSGVARLRLESRNAGGNESFVDSSALTGMTTGWHMVTTTITGSTVNLYYDNVNVASGTLSYGFNYDNGQSTFIGANFDTTIQQLFNGTLDEIGVWSRVLNTGDINQLWNGGAGNQYPWTINYIRALSDSISYSASRSITLTRLETFARSLSDSISYSASRSITLTRLGTFARSLSDSILNSASRFVILTKGQARTLSDSIMNGASRFTSLTRFISYMRGLSDSIMNSVSRFTTIIRFIPFVRNLSDSIMNAKNRLATVSRGIIHFIRNLSDSIMNGALRFVTLKTINPFHSVWKLVIKATTSWKSTTKSKTNWNKKITGQ